MCPHFCVLGQIGGCGIFQLCAYSGPRVTLCELLTTTVGPQPLDSVDWIFPLKIHYGGEKLGQNRGRSQTGSSDFVPHFSLPLWSSLAT